MVITLAATERFLPFNRCTIQPHASRLLSPVCHWGLGCRRGRPVVGVYRQGAGGVEGEGAVTDMPSQPERGRRALERPQLGSEVFAGRQSGPEFTERPADPDAGDYLYSGGCPPDRSALGSGVGGAGALKNSNATLFGSGRFNPLSWASPA